MIPGLVLVSLLACAGCVSKPAASTGAPAQGAPVVPYSKGPSGPPYVKGPTSPPPGVEVTSSQEQSVTETEKVKYELPESPTVEVTR